MLDSLLLTVKGRRQICLRFARPAVRLASDLLCCAQSSFWPAFMESRIEELEIRVAFQDDLLQGLNEQVHIAHQDIARLRAELLSLRDRFDSVKSSGSSESSEEPPPPHY